MVINHNEYAFSRALHKALQCLGTMGGQLSEKYVWVIHDLKAIYVHEISLIAAKLSAHVDTQIIIVSVFSPDKVNSRFPFIGFYDFKIVKPLLPLIVPEINACSSSYGGPRLWSSNLVWDNLLEKHFCFKLHHLKSLPSFNQSNQLISKLSLQPWMEEVATLERAIKNCNLVLPSELLALWEETSSIVQSIPSKMTVDFYVDLKRRIYFHLLRLEESARKQWKIKRG